MPIEEIKTKLGVLQINGNSENITLNHQIGRAKNMIDHRVIFKKLTRWDKFKRLFTREPTNLDWKVEINQILHQDEAKFTKDNVVATGHPKFKDNAMESVEVMLHTLNKAKLKTENFPRNDIVTLLNMEQEDLKNME